MNELFILYIYAPGLPSLFRAQTRHPLEPLAAAEISVAVATVRAAGATPEVLYLINFYYCFTILRVMYIILKFNGV